jgi:hypothetical protein
MVQLVASAPASISTPRPEVSKLLPRYKIIRDVIEQNVEDLGECYLPCPSGKPKSDRTAEENIRYTNYVMRAIFYNFVARTLVGFIGQIFSREIELKVPTTLNALVKDVTGDGLTLEQLAKEACAEALSVGRFALLVDYPKSERAFTKAEVDEGLARPVILPYKAEQIIDWDFKKVGAKWVLCFVVLKEIHDYRGTDGSLNTCNQFRILDMGEDGNGVYRQRVWREGDHNGWVEEEESEPKANGKQLSEIPFTFIGAINNDSKPDMPPMYDMAKINIGHYRNSADYEESVFYIGQPTFVVSGIKEKWWNDVMKCVLRFGSRNGVVLNENATAELLQAQPNAMAKEAMDSKKEQLASMGAEFLRETSTEKTATEAAINDSSRTSAISNAAKNVSAAFQFALEWCAVFQGEAETSVMFKLNSEFDLVRMTESQRAQLLKEFQANVISWTEYRSALHKAGIATEDDAKVKTEIEEKEAAELARTAAEFAIVNPDVPQVTGNE